MAAQPQMVINVAANLSMLKQQMGEGAAVIQNTTAKMANMANSLNGQKIIQQAANITVAMKSINMSVLTAGEAASKLKALELGMEKLRLTGQPIPAMMSQVAASLRQISDVPPPKGIDTIGSKFSTLAVAAGSFLGGMATTAVMGLVSSLGTLVAKSANLAVVEASFESLALGAKASADGMLGAMREASRGLVSDMDLMLAGNKAMLLGLPVTTESMGELAKTAVILGRAMGQDATKSFDDLITALGRSSPLILDNLGLSVKVGEANEKYADALGKSAEALTDAEKKLAFYNEAMTKAREKTEQLGDATATVGDQLQWAWVKITNAIATAVSWLNTNVGAAFHSIGNMIDRFAHLDVWGLIASFKGLGDELALVKEKGDGAIASIAAKMNTLGPAATATAKALKDPTAALAEFDAANKESEAAIRANIAELDAYTGRVKNLAAQFSGRTLANSIKETAAAIQSIGGVSKATEPELKRLMAQLVEWKNSGAKLPKDLALLAAANSATAPTIKKLANAWEDVAIAIAINRVEFNSLNGVTDITLGKTADLLKLLPAVNTAIKIPKTAKERMDELNDSVDTLMQSLTQLATIAGDSFGGWIQKASSALANMRAMNDAIVTGKKLWNELKLAVKEAGKAHTETAAEAAAGGMIVAAAVSWIVGSFIKTLNETKRQQEETAAWWKKWREDGLAREAAYTATAIGLLETYKISWKNLGAAARDARIQEAIKAIIDDSNMLKSIGVTSEGVIRGQAAAVNDLLAKIGESGGTITPVLMPIVEQMIELGLVSEDAMRKIMGLTQNPAPVDWKAMEAAATKYGISIDNMGKGFQQAKLDDTFGTLAADYTLLIEGGANANAVIEKMGPKINEAVVAAQKYGASIPAAMKPAVKAMMDAGELFDENGKQLTDMGALNFAVPIEDSMKELVKLFKDFIEQIKLSTDYINKIPKEVPVEIVYSDNGKGGIGGGNGSGAGGRDSEYAALGGLVTSSGVRYLASGGSVRGKVLRFAPRGTDTVPAMLTPGEGVVNTLGMSRLGTAGLGSLNRGQGAATGTDGGGTMTVQLVLPDGRTLADVVVPWIPGALKRYGLK